jgi:2-dehydro-3-deoxygalactonokinase
MPATEGTGGDCSAGLALEIRQPRRQATDYRLRHYPGRRTAARDLETILASSLDGGFAKRIDAEMLLAGARSAKQIGLGRACFSVRILDQFTVYDANARANFLLGAVLGSDLLTLKNSSAIEVMPGVRFVISGKPILREAIALLVQGDDFFSGEVTVLDDQQQANLAGRGAIAVARERGLLGTHERKRA